MENTLLKQIRDRHQIDISTLRLQRQSAENDSAMRQAKFEVRAAKEASLSYEGSFQSLLDRLKGKKEEKETSLRHDAQKAAANYSAAARQKEVLDRQLSELKQKMEAFPDWNDLRAQAEGETLREWYRLDALYCIETLQPLLEDCRTALVERRNMMNGANVGKVYTYSEQAQIQTNPEKCGEDCKFFIRRLEKSLKDLEISFETGDFFTNPSFFLNASAASHNRRDRVNEAINQVESVQRLFPQWQRQLGES